MPSTTPIEEVCANDEELAETDLLNVVAGLVDKSILIRNTDQHVTRYRMLDTLSDYGRRRLRDSGEYERLMRRHSDWYRDLVEHVHSTWVHDADGTLPARARRAYSNLRAAIEFSLGQTGEPEQALRILLALPWFTWWGRGLFTEGRQWLHLALARSPDPTTLRVRALLLGSGMAITQGDIAAATRLLQLAMALTEPLDDPATYANAAYTRGLNALHNNELAAAVENFGQARAILAQGHDVDLQLRVLLSLALAAALTGDRDKAAAYRTEIVAITGGGYAFRQGLWLYATSLYAEGDPGEAARYQEEYLRFDRNQDPDDSFGTARALQVLAWVATDHHQYQRAATLFGAAETRFAECGTPARPKFLLGLRNVAEQRSRDALGVAAFEDAFRRGRDLPHDDALAYALGEAPHGCHTGSHSPAATDPART